MLTNSHNLRHTPPHRHAHTNSADGGPKTGPTKYDYLRRLARFFNRMQAEAALALHIYSAPGQVGLGLFVSVCVLVLACWCLGESINW